MGWLKALTVPFALISISVAGCTEKKEEVSVESQQQRQCVIRALDHIPSRHGFTVKTFSVKAADKKAIAEQLAFIPENADQAMRISFGFNNTYESASARFRGLSGEPLRASFVVAILPAMTFAYDVAVTMVSGTFELTYVSVCGGSSPYSPLSKPSALGPT